MRDILDGAYERTRKLVRKPDWYMDFDRFFKARLLGVGAVEAVRHGKLSDVARNARRTVVGLFERLLDEGAVRIGVQGVDELDDQDEVRESISEIVIHHSSRAEGITLPSLNALHLLQLYVPVYRRPDAPVLNSRGERQPIYSGHFDDQGNQVFYGYHWKVQPDGTYARLLADTAIGWQADNWAVNTRSVGICIDDDLEHRDPTEASLDAVARIIAERYPQVPVGPETIRGHNETSIHTTLCPGDKFLNGWKRTLLDKARSGV